MNFLKKVISIIVIIITFFIVYFLQVNFFNWFNIAGVKPNLFIVLVLCVGLFIGKNVAIPVGFICGVCLDILAGKQLGVSAIIFSLIGFLGGYFNKNFSKDSKITILLMVAGSTVIFEIIGYIYNSTRYFIQFQVLGFVKILLIEVVFNVLLTIILYPLIQRMGYLFESAFKKNSILTRYF